LNIIFSTKMEPMGSASDEKTERHNNSKTKKRLKKSESEFVQTLTWETACSGRGWSQGRLWRGSGRRTWSRDESGEWCWCVSRHIGRH
jgi:hypothetical protein